MGTACENFLSKYYFPHISALFEVEDDDSVIEKLLQSLVENVDDLGAGFLKG